MLKPPPDLTLSQWADKYRILPPDAPKPGPWRTSEAEFQREPMDAVTDPDVRRVTVMGASQVMKSEILLNAIGYCIHYDPSAIMLVQPDNENAAKFIYDRIQPMINCQPLLGERVLDVKTGQNNVRSSKFVKRFKGGFLSIASAGVPASLASISIRWLMFDEVDRYSSSSGSEGDPVNIAEKRTSNFWDYKILMSSSPGLKGESRIEASYNQSDQREYYLPCPQCGELQTLEFGGENESFGLRWEKSKPESVVYICRGCSAELTEVDKHVMLPLGQWIPGNPDADPSHRGYKINALYSPWLSWERLVREFLDSKNDPLQLQVFVNTRLAESWEERGESVNDGSLYSRREEYKAEVPHDAFVLTAAVDVQKDRLECLVNGWGTGEECWSIDHQVFWGNPDTPEVWEELEVYLNRQFTHETGLQINISATCIDSGGHHTQMVYDFVKNTGNRRVFAIKGMHGEGRPIIGPPSRKRTGQDQRPVDLHMIGVDSVKELLYQRLKKSERGPGYIHFPKKYSEEFFKQLTGEKVVLKQNKRGYKERFWVAKRPRVEALDLFVYSYAALKQLASNWEDWKDRLLAYSDPEKPRPETPRSKAVGKPRRKRRILSHGVRRYGN